MMDATKVTTVTHEERSLTAGLVAPRRFGRMTLSGACADLRFGKVARPPVKIKVCGCGRCGR